MNKFFANTLIYLRAMQAGLVLKADQKKGRDPKIVDRLKYLHAQNDLLQLMVSSEAGRLRMGPEQVQQAKQMKLMLPQLERMIKKYPDATMKQLMELARQPELIKPQVRTRPGPPMKGRQR